MNRTPFQKVQTAMAVTVSMFVIALSSLSQAQDPVLAEMYGRGVHKYFAGDYAAALDAFDSAIDNGSRDPRAYYYRGLVYYQTGREEMARDDWKAGAELEGLREYGLLIGRSLARVQGPMRLELEEIRQVSRLAARERQQAQAQARYEERQDAESEVLRQPGRTVTPPPAPSPAVPAVPESDAETNPFGDDAGLAGGEPTVESENAVSDPLEGAPASGTPPAGTDDTPSGDSPFTPSTDDDPFAPSGSDDPFAPSGGDDMADPLGSDNPFEF